ncbi:MAG: TonB-dependent receptor [Bacteroidales bacterium]|nr:TonB-dependent receptor [Bacteroidales bacterium]
MLFPKLNRKCIAALLMMACGLAVHAQQRITVSGTVTDATGDVVIGAVVMVKGDSSYGGSTTDLDGRFSFSCPAGLPLVVTCIGYADHEMSFRKSVSGLVIEMKEDSEVLEDAVVVGYGVQQRESIVGAISQVTSDALINSGTANVTQALAGKLSGVETRQTSGQPGSNDATIVIRGVSSWNGNDPLVMVDGIEREFSDLDPNEIETISVLKDASATAVFGAKGANGVIIVTTKSGTEGAPKFRFNVDYGIQVPTEIPQWVDSYNTALYANIAKRNTNRYADQFSNEQLEEYRNPSSAINSIRYPNNNWYDMVLRDFASTTNANFNISGGHGPVKYFVSFGYLHEGTIVKQLHEFGNTTYAYDRINYRSNLEVNVTKTTKMTLKFGGNIGIQQYPTGTGSMSTTSVFTSLYTASPLMYPAYFPDWFLEMVPDEGAPNDHSYRTSGPLSGEYPAYYKNPYQALSQGAFEQKTTSKIAADLLLKQKLDFITKGLSFDAKVSLTSSFYRYSLQSDEQRHVYRFHWDLYDLGEYPWEGAENTSGTIYVQPPYSATIDNTARTQKYVFYWEGALNYNRKFGDHAVTGLVLFHQRQQVSEAGFPHREQGLVARGTYDFKKKYLLELNMGYTGSEQFSPANRFGFFPSAAIGYTLSKEEFWKKNLPWWSKFKIRYSDGLVGSDASSSNWLYYASFHKDDDRYVEDTAANYDARWETAHKRDLGFEFGWLKDKFTLEVDLFDEHRKDILITPIVTPFVGIDYKDVNRGAIKKHGMEIELRHKNNVGKDWFYQVGAKLSLNENRITAYEDLPYAAAYQKYAGTPYGAQRSGETTVDSGFFTSVDDLHNYPMYAGEWNAVIPGIYKPLDYNGDGVINTDDLHCIQGSTTSPAVYSFDFGFTYKNFTFSALFYGTHGKYSTYNKNFVEEFTKEDYIIHTSQLNYWTPTNQNADHAALMFGLSPFSWGGGTSTEGYDVGLSGVTWRSSDYLTLKEVYVGYKLKSKKIQEAVGIDAITLSLTGNNLFTITDLIEGDPQRTSLSNSYYPIMSTFKLGVKVSF